MPTNKRTDTSAHNTPPSRQTSTTNTPQPQPPAQSTPRTITSADLMQAITPPRLTETDALKEFNEWRMSRGLPPIIPRSSEIARRGRSMYLSDAAHEGLQDLALLYTGRRNPSAFCEMIGLQILHIEEQPMRALTPTDNES
jgi:hypothetical protein